MDRRSFLRTGCAVAGLAATQSLPSGYAADDQPQTNGANGALRTKIAVSPNWFSGSHVARIEQIAAAGFPAFEDLGAGRWEDKELVRTKCQELGVLCGAIGGGMGTISDWGPNDPQNHSRFVEAVKQAIANALAIGSKRVLALSGAALDGVSKEQQLDALAKAGQLVAPLLADANLVLVWETLNVLVDHPGYFLVYSADGADLVRRTDRPNVKFLFDIYHQQISEGNLIANIRKYHQEIGHFHFADNPGRHEPGTGEINYRNVFKAIYETGYRDIVSCEFGKVGSTDEVLKVLVECDQW